ncbi:hypothetical protein GGR07_001634 [Bacteroides pyogenes]|nr:hypothetical protein [Bacteroides pyogenes]SUV70565.1 Uncharacterised protein [Bacteroides pyogenes]
MRGLPGQDNGQCFEEGFAMQKPLAEKRDYTKIISIPLFFKTSTI